MNLEKMNLVSLNAEELVGIDGGILKESLTYITVIGAVAAWLWEKGEGLGRALAKKY